MAQSIQARHLRWLPVGALLMGFASHQAAGAADDPGKDVFIAQKCAGCHSVESQGIASTAAKVPGGDLSNIGTSHDAEWIGQMLRKEIPTDAGKNHLKAPKGTDEEVAALIAWLANLKQPAS